MNVLLLGGGGREHALAWKLHQSPLLTQLFIASGNAGTAQLGQNVAISPNDFEALAAFALQEKIEMLIVGPEEPLVRGIWDFFNNDARLQHIIVIGPSKAAAQLEGSKAFSKRLMQDFGIPTAAYQEVTTVAQGMAFLQTLSPPYVLKADGLAAGKGVLIVPTLEAAETELSAMLGGKFGEASRRVVIEEFLKGIEFSVFVLTDGENYRILPVAKDYKRIGEGDTGLNTGGMGAVSPVSFVDAAMMAKVETRIIVPTIAALKARGLVYHGFVFIGLIRVDGEPLVIEYNCRLGDPETEAVLPRMEQDLLEVLLQLGRGQLAQVTLSESPLTATTIVLTAGGYPVEYRKGDVINGLSNADGSSDVLVFHAGTTANAAGEILTNGGRVLALTALAADMPTALAAANTAATQINFEGKYFRRDIGVDLGQ
jgi:phosphoribosylamine---glycine ligase